MERSRLLRTYSRRRGRAGGGGVRLVPRAAQWVSPPADPKRLFSTSGSSGGAAASPDDPQLRPPSGKAPRRRRRRKKGRKENRPPREDLWRHVTCRRPREGGPALSPVELLRGPLWCSTPGLPCPSPLAAQAREEEEEEECGDCCSLCPCEALRGAAGREARGGCLPPQLSFLDMDPESPFGKEGAPQQTPPRLSLPVEMPLGQTPASPFKTRSALRHRSSRGRTEWSPGSQEDSLFQAAGRGHGSKPSRPAETNLVTPSSPVRGVSQLQARVCDGKIALSAPKSTAVPAYKQPLNTPGGAVTPQRMAGKLKRVFLEGASPCSIDQNSPQFQPVVVLGDQVVSKWLAQQSSRKQAVSPPLKRKQPFQSKSGTSVTRNNHQVIPACNPKGTGRKACISGFSSKRWGRHRNVDQVRQKKNTGWKQQADSFLLQERLKWNEMDDNLSFSLLPLDSSFKNSSLWRRIRASFSLHKKKKILSEPEGLSNSAASNLSAPSPLKEALHTPFTQKLGYSICPSSSMVLLSSMTSLSVPEAVLTDAEKVFGECQQKGPVSFEECIPPDKMPKCEKIGEGVFGEVFKTESERGTIALKIIPIEGSERVNGEAQKTFSEILPEIIISKELSLLADEAANQTSGFIRLYSVHCVKGAYPEHLLNAWDEYHRLRESENDRPDFFGEQQLFMVLEFEFGGTDLENMRNRQLSSVAVAKSILHQVTASLAVAEEALHFEHRDLHWGNVLVRKTSLKEVTVTLNGESHVLPTQGMLVNIIDYTFSRLERDGLTVYCDLSADDEVFQGRGDYQFDIYRQMKEENANNWADYFPHSNILWLHYLADKLLKEVSYKRKATTSSLKQTQKQLRAFSAEVLGFRSATELLKQGSFFR